MALNPVPLAGQSLLASRDQIANNFTSIDTGFSVNHTAFGAGAGNHSFLTIPAGAAHATLANEVALYSKVGLTSTVPELVFRRNTSGSEIAFTEYSNVAGIGWTKLPSGIVMKWGLSPTGGNGVLTAPIANGVNIPSITTLFSIQTTSHGQGSGDVGVVYFTAFDDTVGHTVTAWHYKSGGGSHDAGFYYLAIGI